MRITKLATCLIASAAAYAPLAALAEDYRGKPTPGGIGWQEPVTEIARDIHWYHDIFLMPVITIISLFVVALLFWVIYRYSAKNNPTPARFTHHVGIEVAWTVIPIIILVAMIPPSINLLFKQEIIPEADLVIKATGNQWYWTYEYPDQEFEFDSVMLQKDELEEFGYMPDEYLLATDTQIVVPVNKTVVMQVTGADVIHAWTIPAFGSKVDAMPGRLNQTWFKAEKTGTYFGQCSELCGLEHAYMPIVVKVVSEEEFATWVTEAREEFAGIAPETAVAGVLAE